MAIQRLRQPPRCPKLKDVKPYGRPFASDVDWLVVSAMSGSLNQRRSLLSCSFFMGPSWLEEVVRECLEAIRPAAPPFSNWPPHNASVRGDLGRFNTPNAENARKLFRRVLGYQTSQMSGTGTIAHHSKHEIY